MQKSKVAILSFLVMLLLQSCGVNSVYEGKVDFKQQSWHADSVKAFTFDIEEEGNYDILYMVKNKTDYPYSNLFIKSDFKGGDVSVTNNLQEVTLFDKKTGKPFGKGFGGMMEHQFYAYKNLTLKKGQHQIFVQHYMRVPQLSGIMAFGISVAKSEQE